MTVLEFDREWELLYNSINNNSAPSINLYEKSVFLTLALEAIVTSLYNGSFEKNELLRRCLDTLIVTANPTLNTSSTYNSKKLSSNSKIYELPSDVLYITYEELNVTNSCGNTLKVLVFPTIQDEYLKISKNPFKGSSDTRALRLEIDKLVDSVLNTTTRMVEIISEYPNYTYTIRYIKKPRPIILYTDQTGTLTIDGQSTQQTCELDSAIHRTILEEAVKQASLIYKQS